MERFIVLLVYITFFIFCLCLCLYLITLNMLTLCSNETRRLHFENNYSDIHKRAFKRQVLNTRSKESAVQFN